MDRCPSEPTPTTEENDRALGSGVLIAAIAPKLIEGVVDAAAEGLKAAGVPRTFTTTHRSGHYFYKVGKDADLSLTSTCLVVVRGTFVDNVQSPAAFQWANNSDVMKTLQRAYFRFEAKVQRLQGAKFFQLRPIYLKVDDFEDFSFFDPKNRDFLVSVSMTVPGASQPFGNATFHFRDVERSGEPLSPQNARLRLATSLPIAFPPETEDVIKARARLEAQIAPWLLALDILTPEPPPSLQKVPAVLDEDGVVARTSDFCKKLREYNATMPKQFAINDERCTFTLAATRKNLDEAAKAGHRGPLRRKWATAVCDYRARGSVDERPDPHCANMAADSELLQARADLASRKFTYVTTEVALGETKEGSKLALFLGNAISNAKTDISAIAKEKLIPRSQSQLDAEDAAARLARGNVQIASLDVIKAEESLAETLSVNPLKPSDVTSARIALLKAKIASNSAHRAAKLGVPYPELD